MLKRFCDKASGHASMPVVSKETACSSTEDTTTRPSVVQSNQVSLQGCPVIIQPDNLWSTAAAPTPLVVTEVAPATTMLLAPSCVAPIQPPMGAGQGQEPAHTFLSPDQIQHIIATAVQQSLSVRLPPPGRAASVRSFVSTSPDEVCQEDTLSIEAPDSPVSSDVSQPSSLAKMALPFGLSSAARSFTKVLAALAASLRARSICLQCYLDDILILTSTH